MGNGDLCETRVDCRSDQSSASCFSARGSVAQAIILYEAALGLGIAVGPLVGGVLGSISWRGPFFGVSALMAFALIGLKVPGIRIADPGCVAKTFPDYFKRLEALRR